MKVAESNIDFKKKVEMSVTASFQEPSRMLPGKLHHEVDHANIIHVSTF